jgi:PAS domain S-box-containing protein
MADLASYEPEGLQRLRELTEGLIGPEMMAGWLEDLPVPFLVVNAEGAVVYFNAASELLFGYPRGEVLGKPVEILVPEAARAAHVNHRASYAEDPRKRPMGIHLSLSARQKSGAEVPVEITLSPRMTAAGLMTSAVVWKKRQ